MDFNPNQARESIMSHYMHPQNKDSNLNEYQTFFSTSCSDTLKIQLTWEGEVLNDAKFDGNGCAPFVAATDMFLNLVKNKTKTEIKELATLFSNFVKGQQLNESELQKIKNLWVFYNIKSQPNRISCSLLITQVFDDV
ncbi:nitrogen fixation NifU-like protein [Mycoplasmopsis mustelae]|uniref:Nitrogen fixation NifU-like protein n=1 Tax=Mycoplasmopsis mustelae TaxID=171289 RepID=A0A4R7UBX4_9BACT|nr:iron-sulfur cluster assembly scaffold protein [Mycoplasmopsis mustelae]TDV23041.1 nitrogen fixation NifU-like protein [Mycoplasmopsis mustelae]